MGLTENLPFGATPIDPSGLIPEYITTKQELYDAEFKNITKAINKYLTTRNQGVKFSLDFFYRIHHDMFNNVWKWAGKKRVRDLNIGSRYFNLEMDLQKLLDDLIFWEQQNLDITEIITYLHHRLVKIHPFYNGNGRWARLIINIYLKQKGYSPINWPEENMADATEFRKTYIKALQKADGLEYSLLKEIHIKRMSLKK